MLSHIYRQRRDAVTAALLFVATAGFTLYQNSRVAALWDLSFLLDTSYRWTLGQMPYRDLPFPYAPLTFLLHAGIIEVFGRVYYPHILGAAAEGGVATVLTWRILVRLLGRLERNGSTMATLLAGPLIFLGIYGVYPHPVYDSDCVLGVLLAIYLLQRTGEGPVRNALAGAACVMPLSVKQNIGGPFLLAVVLGAVAIAGARKNRRETITAQLWLLAGAGMTLVVTLLTMQLVAGLHNYFHWTITFAAQRRLPGLATILGIYRQPSLLWSLPAALVGVLLLRLRPKAQWASAAATFLLCAPFLWTAVEFELIGDVADHADQLLILWPHLLILSATLALWDLRRRLTISSILPIVILAAIHGTFLSQQLWGSTYAIWPLLVVLIAYLLIQIPEVARPIAWVVSFTLLVCGGMYANSHDRLSYVSLDGPPAHATLPTLHGMTTPGPWIPRFEGLVRFTQAAIPRDDQILFIPGEDPFYFATGRKPAFPILLFDPATDPYTPQQTLEQARAHDIRWLIVSRDLQLTALPDAELPEITHVVMQDFVPYRSLPGYDIYRRK